MPDDTPADAEIGEFEALPALTVNTALHTDGDGPGRLTDLADAARAPFEAPNGDLAFVIPDGHSIEWVEADTFLPHPATHRGHAQLRTPQSLVTYVNRFADVGTTLWADRDGGTVTAVLDDATAQDDPAWGEHRATLTLRHTQDWEDWVSGRHAANGRKMGQVEFAEFIEDHLHNLVSPSPADMLELAQTFEATKSVEFREATRLSSSQRQITYAETIASRAGQRGQMTVPEALTLSIAPYEGVDPVILTARFRFRIAGGDLSLWVVIDRPDDALDRVFEVILDDIREGTAIALAAQSMLGTGDPQDGERVHLDTMFGTPPVARR